jgi:hypothetical protein
MICSTLSTRQYRVSEPETASIYVCMYYSFDISFNPLTNLGIH